MYAVTTAEKKWGEALEERNFAPGESLGDSINDFQQILGQNELYRKFLAERDSGRPGHYYGRNMVLEGAVPAVAFFLAPQEYGGDDNWYKDDKKFQDYMKRHPQYDWLNG